MCKAITDKSGKRAMMTVLEGGFDQFSYQGSLLPWIFLKGEGKTFFQDSICPRLSAMIAKDLCTASINRPFMVVGMFFIIAAKSANHPIPT